ncbi:MAG: peptidylprolyl isomerase [Calditrichota bacterium]
MTTLRSQMKTILWILVFAFLGTIVFSWGMGGFKEKSQAGIVGQLHNKDIDFMDFEKYVQMQVERASRNKETPPAEDELKKVREESWDNYVESQLKNRDAKRLKVTVSDREIAHIIENYPPAEVQQAEIFQKDGKFDLPTYQNFLRTPNATRFLLGMEESVRNYLIEQKLVFMVAQSEEIGDNEVRDEFISQSVKGKLEFIAVQFDSIRVDSSEITPEMKRRYYRLFPDRFKEYGQRQFAYIKFKLQPSTQDSTDILHEANNLIKEIRDGADFAELAKEFSEDPGSAANGGDLDWFGRGKMVGDFDEAAFPAAIGEILGPVKSRYGYHIIQVLDRRQGEAGEEIKARHILMKVNPSADTREGVYNEAYNFSQDVAEKGFDAVAAEYSYQVDTTKWFSQAGYITGLGRMRMAAEFCFDNPVGTASGVYNIPEGYVVFKITDAKEEGTKPYEDVESSITKTLEGIIKERRAWTIASDLRSSIDTPGDMQTAAAGRGLPLFVTDDSLSVSGALPGNLRRDADFLKEAFRLKQDEISDLIKGRRAYYIAHMIYCTPIDEQVFQAARPTIYQSLASRKQDAIVKNWVRELRVAADIKDYRYRYFKDF